MINSFWYQLKKFGIWRIFTSIDFVLPLVFVILLERVTIGIGEYDLNYATILDVLIGLFAFIFAALAIVITMSDTKFSKELIKRGLYEGILFHYWYTCIVLLVSIAYVLTVSLIDASGKYSALPAIFLISYSLCIVLSLIKVTISVGIYKSNGMNPEETEVQSRRSDTSEQDHE